MKKVNDKKPKDNGEAKEFYHYSKKGYLVKGHDRELNEARCGRWFMPEDRKMDWPVCPECSTIGYKTYSLMELEAPKAPTIITEKRMPFDGE